MGFYFGRFSVELEKAVAMRRRATAEAIELADKARKLRAELEAQRAELGLMSHSQRTDEGDFLRRFGLALDGHRMRRLSPVGDGPPTINITFASESHAVEFARIVRAVNLMAAEDRRQAS